MRNKALYIILSISIIVLIFIIINIVDIIKIKKERDYQNELKSLSVLKVDLENNELEIIKGEHLSIDYDKKNIEVNINDKMMEIKALNEESSKVKIIVPEYFTFNQLYIKSNKGNISMSDIEAEFSFIDPKSSTVSLNKVNFINKSDISVNSSKMNIKNSNIHNIDLFIDDGTFFFDGILYGRSEINTSTGVLEFNIQEKIDNYHIEISDNNNNIKVNNKIINNKSYTKGKKEIIIKGKGMLNINGGKNEK